MEGIIATLTSPRKRRKFRPEASLLESVCPVSTLVIELSDTPDQPAVRAAATKPVELDSSAEDVAPADDRSEFFPLAVSPYATSSVSYARAASLGFTSSFVASESWGDLALLKPDQSVEEFTLSAIPATTSAITVTVASPGTTSMAGLAAQPAGDAGSKAATSPDVSTSPDQSEADDIRPMTLAPSEASSNAQSPMQTLSGGGGTPPLTQTVFLSGGAGRHSTEPASNPVPWVIEGSAWQGSAVLSGGGAFQFDSSPVSWTWEIPAGMLKGWGVFDTVKPSDAGGDDSGNYYVLNPNIPNENILKSDAKLVTTMGFDADDLEQVNKAIEPKDHVFNKFFFGPATVTGSPVRIKITATFRSKTTGVPDFTGSDYVDVNVAKPTGDISLDSTSANVIPGNSPNKYPTFGTTGVSAVGLNPRQWLQMDGDAVRTATGNIQSPSPHGIDWKSKVYPAATGIGTVSGVFSVTQTMTYSSTRTYRGYPYGSVYSESDGLLAGGVNPGTILDALDYNSFSGTGITTVGGTMAAPTSFVSADVPGSELDTGPTTFSTPIAHSRTDNFTMTLMFSPPGGIWVPVGQYLWSWSGTANWDSPTSPGVWSLTSGTSTPGSYAPTSTFPTWTYSFRQLSNNWQ